MSYGDQSPHDYECPSTTRLPQDYECITKNFKNDYECPTTRLPQDYECPTKKLPQDYECPTTAISTQEYNDPLATGPQVVQQNLYVIN